MSSSHLPFSFPTGEITPFPLIFDSAIECNTVAFANEHSAGRDDVDHGRGSREIMRKPDRERDIVPIRGICDRERAMEGKKKECATVIVSWNQTGWIVSDVRAM